MKRLLLENQVREKVKERVRYAMPTLPLGQVSYVGRQVYKQVNDKVVNYLKQTR